ncbi:MAG: zf-HC2 domain-containing protein [Lachnospiraceae bacterium]|nr:zf-HC2 domain-containing protein [Lachnospiraceae bacterium]
MKCNVVRDLLPLYLDQLCEEETSEEIKDHLEGCEECRQRWEEMGSPVESVIGQLEKETVSIEPMKKYRKKIKRKNSMLVLTILLSVVVIGLLSYLSYGQIRHIGHSFETISQYIRFTHIGKEFAKGNLEPLLSSLAIVGDDSEHAYYAKQAYRDDEDDEDASIRDAYIKDAKEYIRKLYPDYFQGKPLKLRKVIVEYHTEQVYMNKNLSVILIYEIDGIEYCIQLERRAGEKYYVTRDEFVESAEPVTYTAENEDDETEDTDGETEDTDGETEDTDSEIGDTDGETGENVVEEEMTDSGTKSSFLECRESLFRSLPPFDDSYLFVAKKIIRGSYKMRRDSGDTLPPNMFMTSMLYITEECLKDHEFWIEYQEIMLRHAEQIIQQNYWMQDIDYQILSYDKEKHMFRYRINLFMVNVETEKECVLSVECYRHVSEMIVIPGTEKLIGENIAEEAKRAMLNLWKVD